MPQLDNGLWYVDNAYNKNLSNPLARGLTADQYKQYVTGLSGQDLSTPGQNPYQNQWLGTANTALSALQSQRSATPISSTIAQGSSVAPQAPPTPGSPGYPIAQQPTSQPTSQPQAAQQAPAALPFIPGAYESTSTDPLRRGLTADQWNAYNSAEMNALAQGGDPTRYNTIQSSYMQQANDALALQAQQQKQQTDATNIQNTAMASLEAARQKALGSVPGIQKQLGDDLLQQEQYAYGRMEPQMEARLNALGLLQSGALPEAQAKYQGDLESQRQARLSDFGTNANQLLQIQQPLTNANTDVGLQTQAWQNALESQRAGLSRQFGQEDVLSQSLLQQNLAQQAIQAAQAQQQQQNQTALLGAGIGAIGSIGGGYLSQLGGGNSTSAALAAYRKLLSGGGGTSLGASNYGDGIIA